MVDREEKRKACGVEKHSDDIVSLKSNGSEGCVLSCVCIPNRCMLRSQIINTADPRGRNKMEYSWRMVLLALDSEPNPSSLRPQTLRSQTIRPSDPQAPCDPATNNDDD